ncbi:hypothetical protein J2S44_003668 [Catenuloplanes niger]|uniref:Uncharacterized protein n=1 Tax=Catenuloplanes niger TaxID=587534 RepID=A0AAE3ZNX3_9ACTN|nr:hypothetical protein [Catenuloplanes niger]
MRRGIRLTGSDSEPSRHESAPITHRHSFITRVGDAE